MRPTEGTSVIVTGGGSGLGAATAEHMARRGARVTICSRRPEKVKSVAESIGPNCAWVRADVDDPDDRARIIDAALEHGGGIDVLVNNAGNRYAAPLAEIEEDQVAAMYQTNVTSPIMLSQLALPHLAERKGAIIFIGSVDVRRALPPAVAYAPAKAAVHRLTGVLRRRGSKIKDSPSTACATHSARRSSRAASTPRWCSRSSATRASCRPWTPTRTCWRA